MALPRRARTLIVLIFAAIGPFAAIWSASVIASRLSRRPSTIPSVTLFSDYVTQSSGQLTVLPSAQEIWTPELPSAPFFKDVLVFGADVIVAGHTRLYLIDPHTRRLRQEYPLPAPLHGVSAITSLYDSKAVTTYSFESGVFSVVDIAGGPRVRMMVTLDTALGEPFLGRERVIANGAFADELVRVYALGVSTKNGSRSRLIAQRGGSPLFPGMTRGFARHLNVTSMDVSPTRDKLALAFRWSDRVHILDAESLRLERSIAGPVETKLSFGVAEHQGERLFALDGEATHSYADVVATSSAVIAMYSGREKRKFGRAMGLGSALHVFTWDGRLVGEWALPEPLQKIAFDPDTETLYALRGRPKPALLAIDGRMILKAVSAVARDRATPRRGV